MYVCVNQEEREKDFKVGVIILCNNCFLFFVQEWMKDNNTDHDVDDDENG